MSYLLDADWIIQSLGRRPQAARVLDELAPEGVFVNWVTVGEVYEVAFRSSNPQAHLDAFRRFLRPFREIDLDEPTIERFAEIRAWLRRRGELIPDLDILLGATALRQGLTVLTFNARTFATDPGASDLLASVVGPDQRAF